MNVTKNIAAYAASSMSTLAVADQVAFSDELYIMPEDAYTVTNGSTITVTGAVMELTAAGAVGADLPAATDGRVHARQRCVDRPGNPESRKACFPECRTR